MQAITKYTDVKKAVIRRNTARCLSALEAVGESKRVRDIIRAHFKACYDNDLALKATGLDVLSENNASEYAIKHFMYCKELLLEDLDNWEEYDNRFNR